MQVGIQSLLGFLQDLHSRKSVYCLKATKHEGFQSEVVQSL